MKTNKIFVFAMVLSILFAGCSKKQNKNIENPIKITEATSDSVITEETTSVTESSSELLIKSSEEISEKETFIKENDEKANQKEEQYHDDNIDIVLPEQDFENNAIETKENSNSNNQKATEVSKKESPETVSTAKIYEKGSSTSIKTTTKKVETEKRIELPEVNF